MTLSPLEDTLTVLYRMAQTAEARTPHTARHSERVALVAMGIGRELGLSEADRDRLLVMGRLHNLGVAGSRDSILLKTGALTRAEFAHVKEHTILGAKLLAPFPELADVAEVCLNHHERWDGTGYPNGIAGENIPFFARLIAVADVFSAIISPRPHRDSLPRPVAADIIGEERGTTLCPRCVDGFLGWFARTGGMIDLPEGV